MNIEIINETLFMKGIMIEWEIGIVDNELFIDCFGEDGTYTAVLNQQELKTLVEFLQTKIK